MNVAPANVLKHVGNFLDNPLIRWTGSILTLVWIVSLAVGLLGRVLDSGYETVATGLIVVGVLGLLLQLLVAVRPGSATAGGPPKDAEVGADAEAREIRATIEAELVALIDEWKALRPSEFEETANAPYSFLLRRTSEFLETTLGRADAQRFEDNGSEKPGTFNQLVDLRIRALSLLRDAPDRWRPQVDLGEFAEAVAARKEIDYGSAILIAGSPLEDHYEIPADPDSFASSSSTEATEGEAEEERATVATLALGDDLETALRTEKTEGEKLLKALKAGVFGSWQYDRVPTPEDVHGWQANVEHLLRNERELLQLFRWQPLTRNLGIAWTTVADAIVGGPQIRRLEGLLAQLDKVIERLSR